VHAQKTTKVIFSFGKLNNRYGKFGSTKSCFRATTRDVGSWSMAGIRFDEIVATKQPVGPSLPVAAKEQADHKFLRPTSFLMTG